MTSALKTITLSRISELIQFLVTEPKSQALKQLVIAMTLGHVFLQSVTTGVITTEEMNWITNNQRDFSRVEEATALKLGRFLDSGLIQIGCRI